jgi:AraC-like DNA-binding protein
VRIAQAECELLLAHIQEKRWLHPSHAYVMRQRMRHAQDIMLSSEHHLSRIALECGICDQAHFSRVFRKLVGANPWAWRRQFSSGPRMEPIASGNHAADLARQS